MAVLHSPPSSGRRRCQAVVMGIGVAMEVEVAVAAVYMLMVPASRQLPARPGGGLLALVVVVVVLANGRLLLLLRLLLVVVLCINMKDSYVWKFLIGVSHSSSNSRVTRTCPCHCVARVSELRKLGLFASCRSCVGICQGVELRHFHTSPPDTYGGGRDC